MQNRKREELVILITVIQAKPIANIKLDYESLNVFLPRSENKNKEVLFYHSKSSIILEVPARVTRQEKVKVISRLEKEVKLLYSQMI